MGDQILVREIFLWRSKVENVPGSRNLESCEHSARKIKEQYFNIKTGFGRMQLILLCSTFYPAPKAEHCREFSQPVVSINETPTSFFINMRNNLKIVLITVLPFIISSQLGCLSTQTGRGQHRSFLGDLAVDQ